MRLAITTPLINFTFKKFGGKDTTFGISHSQTQHLRTVPALLTGNDNLSSTLLGLKDAWSLNVSRAILADNMILGFDVQRATIYPGIISSAEAQTYTYTFDLVTYL